MELGGTTVEESVGQGAADTLVKEDEHQSNPDAFLGGLVGVSGSVTRILEPDSENLSLRVLKRQVNR